MYQLYQRLDTKMKQLARDNGQKVRRSYNLHSSNDRQTSSYSGFQSVAGGLNSGPDVGQLIQQQTTRFWFSGACRYYIPDLGPSRWPARIEAKLFGADINPEVIWNAIPWTWLFDWFTNASDVIANFSRTAAENLVWEYGYVMGTKESTNTYDLGCPIRDWNRTYQTIRLISEQKVTVKGRAVGYPYSFGLSPGSLSNIQLAILGALGLTRSGGHF
jgi:hypothetical protein